MFEFNEIRADIVHIFKFLSITVQNQITRLFGLSVLDVEFNELKQTSCIF